MRAAQTKFQIDSDGFCRVAGFKVSEVTSRSQQEWAKLAELAHHGKVNSYNLALTIEKQTARVVGIHSTHFLGWCQTDSGFSLGRIGFPVFGDLKESLEPVSSDPGHILISASFSNALYSTERQLDAVSIEADLGRLRFVTAWLHFDDNKVRKISLG